MMATMHPFTLNLSADTKRAMFVAKLLYPLVWLRLLTVEQGAAIAMRFVKVNVTVIPA